MKRIFKITASILPYLFVFIASLYLPKDPDLGWHLKYGEYFFQHGYILQENIFSNEMPHYIWPNGSWGTDIITYALYHNGGFLALIIASALIVTATFFFFARAAKLSLLEHALFFPILAYLVFPLNNHSFRGHQITMLLLGVLFFLLSRYKTNSKILWFVPVLFFIWMNLQIESFLGFAVFGIWVGCMWIKSYLTERKLFIKEQLFLGEIFLITFLVTFLNPFGWRIHSEAIFHIFDPLMKKVNDYVPFLPFTRPWWNEIVVLGMLMGGTIYLSLKKKFTEYLPWIIIPLVLILLSFNIRRYVWPAYYTFFPLLHIIWQPFASKLKKYGFVISLVFLTISFIYVIYLKMPFTQLFEMSWQTYCQRTDPSCTDESASYLQRHKLTNHLFTFYDWGGWLIWNYPDIKPSTDGRMHVWRDENGYSAFANYDDYMNAKKNIDASSYDVIYIPMERTVPLFIELDELVRQEKWKLVYDDGKVGIVVRVK